MSLKVLYTMTDGMTLKPCMIQDGMTLKPASLSMYTAEPLHNGRRQLPAPVCCQTQVINRNDQMLYAFQSKQCMQHQQHLQQSAVNNISGVQVLFTVVLGQIPNLPHKSEDGE